MPTTQYRAQLTSRAVLVPRVVAPFVRISNNQVAQQSICFREPSQLEERLQYHALALNPKRDERSLLTELTGLIAFKQLEVALVIVRTIRANDELAVVH